jgi:hypothetical protein
VAIESFIHGETRMTSYLNNWTQTQFDQLEEGILLAGHALHESGLFDDENLIRMIDSHPPQHLGINTMGYEEAELEWREGHRNGVPADVLLKLVRTGRLWINLRNVLDHHPQVHAAIDSIYNELEANKPGFVAEDRSANLLISSPGAIVHYHIDVPVNMLWHLRGKKRVWVYPPFDFQFVSQEVVEAVCNNEQVEDVPYTPAFDQAARVFDVEPGQLLTWPQLTPHRVTNLEGLNVSLSTEHKNPRARRRINVHLANQWLRRTLHRPSGSTSVDGVAAHAKQALARCVRKSRKLFGTEVVRKNEYPVTFKVDPDAPAGFTLLDQPLPPKTRWLPEMYHAQLPVTGLQKAEETVLV